MKTPFELFISLTYTRAGRRGRRKDRFMSFISAMSVTSIALGVAALIIVLSVMNGFQKEVRDRMLSVVPHIEVMGPRGALNDWHPLADAVLQVPGVVSDGRLWRVTDVADGKAVLEANHPLAGIGLQFAIRVLKVEEPDESEGLEERPVVPGFLQVADKLVAEDDEDDLSDEEMDRMLENRQSAEPDTSSMAKLAKAPRIIR